MMLPVRAATHDQSSNGVPTGARRAPAPAGGPATPSSPAARRYAPPSWRDPRLVVGLVIVATSVLLGARLLAGADDTVAVWSLRHDLPAGADVTAEDLQSSELRFGSDAQAAAYLSAGDAVPSGMTLLRDVTAGELLPRAALGPDDSADLAEVPISVSADAVPAGLGPGETVDVWVTASVDAQAEPRAKRVLEGVTVLATPETGGALGPSATRQVVVAVAGDQEDLLARALAELSEGTAVLVRRG